MLKSIKIVAIVTAFFIVNILTIGSLFPATVSSTLPAYMIIIFVFGEAGVLALFIWKSAELLAYIVNQKS